MTIWYREVKAAKLDTAILDYGELVCPRCGCNDVELLKLPREGTWYASSGKARCHECDATFALKIETEE